MYIKFTIIYKNSDLIIMTTFNLKTNVINIYLSTQKYFRIIYAHVSHDVFRLESYYMASYHSSIICFYLINFGRDA